LIKIVKHRQALAISAIIFGNIILHLILDSIVGDIAWLYPLSDKQFALFTVPAKYTFWIWSFVLHWTFLFEICVLIAAGILFSRERKRGSGGRATS
jgi:inner membrane protein